jgi:hypothetical protein
LSADTDVTISSSIISNLGDIISINGMIKNENSNWFYIPRPNTATGSDNNRVSAYYNTVSGIHVLIGSMTLGSNSKCYIVIEYTKTTD